jgi:SAM-dependent methyltransferase
VKLRWIDHVLGVPGPPAAEITRSSLAGRYIRGRGIEIGALHAPLSVPRGAVVRYVDRVTRAESLRAFPELDPARIVEPDYVTDGFSLTAIHDCSQDFVIANHVLEHTPNPLAAVVAWHRVLRPCGVIFACVPMVDKTFDRGRPVTPPQHMLEDWQARKASAQVTERDLPHYREWVTISLRAISLQNGTPLPGWNADEIEHVARTRMEESDEIHFHTFSCASYGEFLTQVVSSLLPDLHLVELHECSGYEAVAVLVKS